MGRAAVLTREQMLRYERDGFLAVTEPLLPLDEVISARDRIDRLFDRWSSLPRWLASGMEDDGAPPALAQIHRVTSVDLGITRCRLIDTCREIAIALIGARHMWCRFDSAIYKYPGAGPVHWHQDFALSRTRMSKQSVHFWIPLNDHPGSSGGMAFVPGSHRTGPVDHQVAEPPWQVVPKVAAVPDDAPTVSETLSLGSFTIHNPWTIHSSGPNCGDTTRKALCLEFSSGAWSATRELGRPLVNALLVRPLRSA
jgi:hypothetical protein